MKPETYSWMQRQVSLPDDLTLLLRQAVWFSRCPRFIRRWMWQLGCWGYCPNCKKVKVFHDWGGLGRSGLKHRDYWIICTGCGWSPETPEDVIGKT